MKDVKIEILNTFRSNDTTRPSLNYVQQIDEFLYATNGVIACWCRGELDELPKIQLNKSDEKTMVGFSLLEKKRIISFFGKNN